MKLALLCGLSLALASSYALAAEADKPSATKDAPLYEMRIYYAPEGKLDALHARFRDHTLKLFEKHGMKNVGYWVPLENPDRKLVYLLEHASQEAREKSWKEFNADPDWKKAHAASEKDGRLVAKAEITFLQTTDYSPALKIENVGDRVFELRTYTTTANSLDDLDDRFRKSHDKAVREAGHDERRLLPSHARSERGGKHARLFPRAQEQGSRPEVIRRLPRRSHVARRAQSFRRESGRFADHCRRWREVGVSQADGLLAAEVARSSLISVKQIIKRPQLAAGVFL
jgi:hypothetical protein